MRSKWVIVGLSLWLASTAGAMTLLTRYKGQGGERGVAPAHWPEASRIPRTPGLGTAVVFIHPRCPCSRATLTELREAMSGRVGHAQVVVLFYVPTQPDAAWLEADTWREAGSIPGVDRITDVEGAESLRFGALTSGHVVFYDASGELRMNGGITTARGHEGDNAGRRELQALLDGSREALPETPVFGCPLHERNEL